MHFCRSLTSSNTTRCLLQLFLYKAYFSVSWFYIGKHTTHMFPNQLKIFTGQATEMYYQEILNFSAQKILTWKGTMLKFRKKTSDKYKIKNLHYNISVLGW